MASTYTANIGAEKPATGDRSGTWGTMTNTNMDIIDRAIAGVGAITLSGTTHTLTTTDGSLTDGMYKVLVLGGSPSGTNTITISPNDQDKLYFVVNSSGQIATFTQGTGANVSIPNGGADIIYADGAGAGAAVASVLSKTLTTGNIIIPDAGNIGSASDTNAIAVSSAGVVALSATTEASATTTAALTVAGGLGVAKDVWIGDDLVLDSDSTVISLGADQDVTVTHVADSGVTLKNTSTGDDTPFVLLIQTGETDIAADDVLGKIQFQAPDEAAGTDAILVAAEVAAVSEGDFSSSSNATKLSFKTGASEAAAEKMSLSSAGDLTISNDVILDSDSAVIKLGDDQDVTLTHVADSGVQLEVTGNNVPQLYIKENKDDGNAGPFLTLNRFYADTTPADNDQGGSIQFNIQNDHSSNTETATFAQIGVIAKDVSDGSEDGELQFYTMVNGTSTNIMQVGSAVAGHHIVLPGSDSTVHLGTDSNYQDLGEGVNKWYRVHADRVVCGTGTTTTSTNAGLVVMAASGQYGVTVKTGATSLVGVSFETSGGGVGSIQSSTTATTYYTSSDYRLKENVTDMTGAITRVKNLKPKRFNFKIDSSTTVDGFLAHEAAEVVPKAVGGEKDAVKDDGSIDPQQIDHSVMIPLLTGALQEAIAKIEVLESKVAALEAS